ncbi:MAG TPA: MBL fold metallo-hydrolase [Syntrophales bacterium]|nr:MBL fold metallo-hydrolase [Syntrophales bacterium]
MASVRQFRYGADNFGYVIHGQRQALVIDGGAVAEILRFTGERGLRISLVGNTHSHADHTSGNAALLRETGAEYLAPDVPREGHRISLGDESVTVMRTPGHTKDSICFLAGIYLISGDTLFNGTIGNCFSGDQAAFHRTVKALMALTPETVVYAGHDYVKDSIAFARKLEPGNRDLDSFAATYDPRHVFSTLADEFRINPYFRFNAKPIVDLLRRRNLPVASEEDRWRSLMSIE